MYLLLRGIVFGFTSRCGASVEEDATWMLVCAGTALQVQIICPRSKRKEFPWILLLSSCLLLSFDHHIPQLWLVIPSGTHWKNREIVQLTVLGAWSIKISHS